MCQSLARWKVLQDLLSLAITYIGAGMAPAILNHNENQFKRIIRTSGSDCTVVRTYMHQPEPQVTRTLQIATLMCPASSRRQHKQATAPVLQWQQVTAAGPSEQQQQVIAHSTSRPSLQRGFCPSKLCRTVMLLMTDPTGTRSLDSRGPIGGVMRPTPAPPSCC